MQCLDGHLQGSELSKLAVFELRYGKVQYASRSSALNYILTSDEETGAATAAGGDAITAVRAGEGAGEGDRMGEEKRMEEEIRAGPAFEVEGPDEVEPTRGMNPFLNS